MRAWLSRAAFVAVTGVHGVALACPVCFSAKDEAQRQAFFDTTIFLTLLPLALIGGIAYWIFQRSLRLVLGHTGAVEQVDGIFGLRGDMAPARCLGEPA